MQNFLCFRRCFCHCRPHSASLPAATDNPHLSPPSAPASGKGPSESHKGSSGRHYTVPERPPHGGKCSKCPIYGDTGVKIARFCYRCSSHCHPKELAKRRKRQRTLPSIVCVSSCTVLTKQGCYCRYCASENAQY